MPPPTALREVADHIDAVIASGSHSQRKTLIEALVAQVKITGPGRIVPVFRIPQATGTGADSSGEVAGVRAMTNLVGRTPHQANRPILIEGDSLPVRLRRSRTTKAAQ